MEDKDLIDLIDMKLNAVDEVISKAYHKVNVEEDLNEWFKNLPIDSKIEAYYDFKGINCDNEGKELFCFKCHKEIHSCVCRYI